jgi:hypothetical protein
MSMHYCGVSTAGHACSGDAVRLPNAPHDNQTFPSCCVQVYYDPLTRRKFMSRNAYLNTVNSNKYKEAVRRSGQPAPEPIVRTVTQGPPSSAAAGARTHAGSRNRTDTVQSGLLWLQEVTLAGYGRMQTRHPVVARTTAFLQPLFRTLTDVPFCRQARRCRGGAVAGLLGTARAAEPRQRRAVQRARFCA